MVKTKRGRSVPCGLVGGVPQRVHTSGTQVPRLPFQQWFGFTFVRDPSSELKSKMRSSFVIQDSDAIVASRSESNRSQIRQNQQDSPENSGVSSTAVRERRIPVPVGTPSQGRVSIFQSEHRYQNHGSHSPHARVGRS